MDVNQIGKIRDGCGWRIHGRGSTKALTGWRSHRQKVSYTYLHSMENDSPRLAYAETPEDETDASTIGLLHRALVFFAAHGLKRTSRLVTNNSSN